ncbi:cupin domain-containing protein [Alterisphingorhabdus coralli]|uniref:Cupin domain-containing protein n=1 Tax=Alterisphingorhabdus coralli TaxID=3071408 RepID=A0AA97F9S2_9SPHN|nr:cupin domain-containing protein [Parasphingorhabdus sp. SCSIO 66989]WOE75877.1 cupin domain-containing protein [Parasphingorhabdus sp. SCSIO 66989]
MAIEKLSLDEAFATIDGYWQPKIAADVNDAQVKLAKFKGAFDWHHHEAEDELFLVIAGQMRMGLRDSEGERFTDLDAGEMIMVPHGVEHRPEALSEECHVLMVEPNSTLNTGNVTNDRTVTDLERL